MPTEAARDGQQRVWAFFGMAGPETEAAAGALAAGRLADELGKLAGWLGDAPYVSGERVLIADYFVVTVLDEAAAFFPSAVQQATSLAAYRRRMYHRPGPAPSAPPPPQPDPSASPPTPTTAPG